MVDINTKFRIAKTQWGKTARSNRIGLSIHHTVTAEGRSRGEIESLIAGINRQHPYGSYGWIVDYTGTIYEIVGIDNIGAAVGGANTPWLAVAYLGDGRARFTREAERAIRLLLAHVEALCGKTLQVKGHGQINATACPGTLIQTRINLGAFTQRYSEAHIRAVQNGLLKLGYDLGSWGADGDWGAMLSVATGDFQRKHGLFVDEIPGPATLAKINAEVAKLGTPKPPTTPPAPPKLEYVRWAEPIEMVFVKPATLFDFDANAPVSTSSFSTGDKITVVGEVQEEGVIYLMTAFSFGLADVTGKPTFPRGIPKNAVEVFVAPEPPEDEDPHEPEPEPEPEPTPEPEEPSDDKEALAEIITRLGGVLSELEAWLRK